MKNSTTFIFTIVLLVIIQLASTSCSRKSYPETTTHKHKPTSSHNNAKATHVTSHKISSGSETETKHEKTTSATSEIKTNNKALNNFLNNGYGKDLSVGNTTPEELIKTAKKYIGTPHRMGGTSTKGIDCSGLVMMAFANNGISLPHNSEEQARYGKVITEKGALIKGDLVFFVNTYKTSKYITHAGIYIGNNQFIHTSSSKGVTITSMDNSWWKDKFIFGTRVF